MGLLQARIICAMEDNRPETKLGLTRSIVVSFLEVMGLDAASLVRSTVSPELVSLDPHQLIPDLLDLVAAVGVRPHSCLYVSTPITTGKDHFRTNVGSVGDGLVRADIIAANIRRARDVVEELRSSRVETVIDPTGLMDVPGWEQNDYHMLWVATIERSVKEILFIDGWQYSVGCTKEFGAALRLQLPILDLRGAQLDYSVGLELLSSAAQETAEVLGVDAPLIQAVAEVEQFASDVRPKGGIDLNVDPKR